MTTTYTNNKPIIVPDCDLIRYVNSGMTSRDISKLYSTAKSKTGKIKKRIYARLLALGFGEKLKENQNKKIKQIGFDRKFKLNVDEFIQHIQRGYTASQIINNLNIKAKDPHLMIREKATEFGMWNILNMNNKCHKNPDWNPYKIEKSHGHLISTLVHSGHNLKQICEELKLKDKIILKYLKFKPDLNKMRLQNSLETRRRGVVLAWKSSKEKTTGKHLKTISDDVKDKFLELKNSGKYCSEISLYLYQNYGFGEKKYYQLCKLFGKPDKNPQTGKLNPMYGKSPSNKAGIGIKSHILIDNKLIFCRSLLELKLYCYLNINSIKFTLSNHRIKYKYLNCDKTYCPDIVIDDVIYEIKPESLKRFDLNVAKHKALVDYCDQFNLKCDYMTENTYDLSFFDIDFVQSLIDDKIIIINEENFKRLKKYASKNKRN